MKKVYITNTVHPNMNYDRSSKSIIWEKFPAIYRLFLDYVEANPATKVHFQLPGQTFESLKICAPDVLDRIHRLYEKKRVRYMGTYYSEPVGMCLNGMTALDSAMLGTSITKKELGPPEGFFIQEVAYYPQLPYIIDRLDVQWVIIKNWEGKPFFPYTLEGLDGSRCVGVPTLGVDDIASLDPASIPDNALLTFQNDLEIPDTIKKSEELRKALIDAEIDAEWTFVSDYIRKHGLKGSKKPGPSTNKAEGSTRSPSHSRWVSKPIDIETHRLTLKAMEAYRRAGILSVGAENDETEAPAGHPRSDITWNVESLNDYPDVERNYFRFSDRVHPLERSRHLLVWGTNSDARGWYPMYERTIERRESFIEASRIADDYALGRLSSAADEECTTGSGFWFINNTPFSGFLRTHTAEEPLKIVHGTEMAKIISIRRSPEGYEHLIRFDASPYHAVPILFRRESSPETAKCRGGKKITKGTMELEERDGALVIRRDGQEATLALAPFEILVKRLDDRKRPCRPEGSPRVSVIPGESPSLIIEKQIDWHVHHKAVYTTDGDAVYVMWKFHFTAPALVDAELPETLGEMDFAPGGIKARLETGDAGEIWYDGPFGEIRHPREEPAYIAALSHVLCRQDGTGYLLASQTGAQSFRVCGKTGEISLCLGRSTTSGGRRKLNFHVGNDVDDVRAETEWYKEPFYGEYVHRFVIRKFSEPSSAALMPAWGRAYGFGTGIIESIEIPAVPAIPLYDLSPSNVVLEGFRHAENLLVLNETCGTASSYRLKIGGKRYEGDIVPFGIVELPYPA